MTSGLGLGVLALGSFLDFSVPGFGDQDATVPSPEKWQESQQRRKNRYFLIGGFEFVAPRGPNFISSGALGAAPHGTGAISMCSFMEAFLSSRVTRRIPDIMCAIAI